MALDKRLFAVKFFSESSLSRTVLDKAFAEGFWAFAECPGPSAKRAPPVVIKGDTHEARKLQQLIMARYVYLYL